MPTKPQEDHKMPRNPDKLHGNAARIDPKKDVESLGQTFILGEAQGHEHETPVVSDKNVQYGRKLNHEIQL